MKVYVLLRDEGYFLGVYITYEAAEIEQAARQAEFPDDDYYIEDAVLGP